MNTAFPLLGWLCVSPPCIASGSSDPGTPAVSPHLVLGHAVAETPTLSGSLRLGPLLLEMIKLYNLISTLSCPSALRDPKVHMLGMEGPGRGRYGSQEPINQRGRVQPSRRGPDAEWVVSAVCLYIVVLCVM